MALNGGLTAAPLDQNFAFNWVFLVELVVCGILTLFFLFYFNRLFATLLSYGLRAYTWHRYRVYIDIQALQISLLGGRVFFKGFRYHGNNETILIHSGYITWCYWLRAVRELDIGPGKEVAEKVAEGSDSEAGKVPSRQSSGHGDGAKRSTRLPCRLNASFQGAEWFVYNRSPAYDSVMAGLAKDGIEPTEDVSKKQHEEDDPSSTLRKRVKEMGHGHFASSKNYSTNLEEKPSTDEGSSGTAQDDLRPHESLSRSQSGADRSQSGPPSGNSQESAILRFLPIHIDCVKAAVVLGNENTKSVLVTKAEKISGEIDASRSPSSLDQYRQLFNLHFEHPVVQMKPNDDYKEDQTSAAVRIKRGDGDQLEPVEKRVRSHSFWHRHRRKAWHKLQDLVPRFRSSVESAISGGNEPTQTGNHDVTGQMNWQGLSRYLDDSEKDDRARWSTIEYATVTTIADSPQADMSFYWDVTGVVQENSTDPNLGHGMTAANINGDESPGWGINLSLKGATVNYGPWADRQRADLQRVFFPSLCKDAIPAKDLIPGQNRAPTEFKVYIELDEETTLRVPIREESKNWKWAKHVDTMDLQKEHKKPSSKNRKVKAEKSNQGAEVRPFGWLDVKVGPNATVSYVMDMMASNAGYSNGLTMDLPHLEITTSVNHGLLWRSTDNHLACDLSNPLQWNGHHTWKFDIKSNGLELFILREHVFLLIDFVDDWASGPPPEYLTFSPFKYLVDLHLKDFRIYLNVNDANIINNPSDFDDNTYISIFGSILDAGVCIPLDAFRPHRNDITFDVDARHGGLNLHVPPWNTQATFLSSTEIAALDELSIDGTYQYCATTSTSNTDILLLNVHGSNVKAQIYGFIIRYYLKIKDNYFGDDIRFRTLEEYQEVLHATLDGGEQVVNQPPHKKSNDLDVILSVSATDSSAILPAGLYTAINHTQIDISSLALDLRFTNYYMELEVTFDTLAFSQGNTGDGTATPMSALTNTQLFIDGITVSGNRLFGLPPTEPTYICNWDFAVGAITGECTTDFFNRLAKGGRAVGFSFDDDENALPSIVEEVLHDVTYLRANIESIRVWIHVDEAAFLLSTGSISVNFNDLAGSHYSKKLSLDLPDLQIACVDAESASRHRSRPQHPVETHALIETTISFVMIQRKLKFREDRQLQQEHIKRHDQRTHRTGFLLNEKLLDDSMLVAVDPPAMKVPPIPLPLSSDVHEMEEHSMSSKISSMSSVKHAVGRKSSFLSISSHSRRSTASLVRPNIQISADSRSRGLQVQTGQSPLRDISVSSGQRSSFYSTVGETRGLPPSSVTFTSSFMAPYFPLEGVSPDARHLPSVPDVLEEMTGDKDSRRDGVDITCDNVNEDTEHVSFMLELPCGIRGVFTPQAVEAVATLLTALQPIDPSDILDELQIECMNDIFALNRQKTVKGQVNDFKVSTPCIAMRFLNSSVSAARDSPGVTVDQYDLSISDVELTTRSKVAPKSAEVSEEQRKASVAHLSVRSISIAAKERYNDTEDPQAAINAFLEDLVFWVASDKESNASIFFKGLEMATVSNKIEYHALLLHRTGVAVSSMAELFSSRLKQQQNRVQLCTYLVATFGQQTPDPLYLTRPSYVLRSASDHLRNSDSWKVVTRLHHMYTSLEPSTRQDITLRCLNNAELVPENARHQVFRSFTQWRSWDLNNVQECTVMSRVYGSDSEWGPKGATHSKPTSLIFNTENIRLVLDPGPKQNEISLTSITATVASRHIVAENKMTVGLETQFIQSTTIQVFCVDASINLNWELCELSENILNLYQETESKPASAEPRSPTSELHELAPKSEWHVVVATEKGSITLETINLNAAFLSQGLKSSFLMTNMVDEGSQQALNLVVAADAVTSKFKSRSQELTLFQLRFPTICASHEATKTGNTPMSTSTLAANCQELSFVVRQDVSALVEVLDLVVVDEVAQLHQLTKKLPNKGPSQAHSVPSTPTAAANSKVSVALFLDEYHISIPLLHSLTYNISGVVARASVAAQLGSEIIFDFDVKENSHNIKTLGTSKVQSISLLQLPPTNGRITTHMSKQELTVSVFASVEPVEIDAAAIHSLLTAVNRPEIASVLSDVKEDFKVVQKHIDDIFGQEQKPTVPSSSSGRQLVYDAHFTLAGFNIFANSQGAQKGQNSARLDFNLGCVQLVVANRLEQHSPILEYPELRVSMKEIIFELSRRHNERMEPCGNLSFGAFLTATSKPNHLGTEVRSFHLKSDASEVNLYADTASSVVDIIGHLQDKIKKLDLSREKEYLRRFSTSKPRLTVNEETKDSDAISNSTVIFASMYSLELLSIQVSWLVGTHESELASTQDMENLVLSFKRIDLSTRKENSARLTIEDLQLQMVPTSQSKSQRSLNSALLPEVIFNVGYVSSPDARRLAFQAAGKSLDLRLTSHFIIPAANLQKSIGAAAEKVRAASEIWLAPPAVATSNSAARVPFFGNKRMESLLVDADFAGAVVYLSGKKIHDDPSIAAGSKSGRVPQPGRYGQFNTNNETSSSTVLRSPGLAWKVEYKDNGLSEPSLNAEVKVNASSNILYPAVVPLVMEITSAVKEIISDNDDGDNSEEPKASPQTFLNVEEDNILAADPSAILGRTRLNFGLRICRQEFSLSCQPIARVAATARFEDIYLTINTVRSSEHGHFFTASAAFSKLQASVQHVYSRESTGSFDVDSVILSLMNSKHVSGTSGLSAILKISPMKVLINAKQLQDFLLFREIWIPPEIRQNVSVTRPTPSITQSQTILVQRYQQVASTGAFPWNATISIEELDVQLDLGQAIGKSAFMISNFWLSSKKNSDWEQNLCLGFDKVGVDSTGRMSGFVQLQHFKLRTSIQWPAREKALNQTPLVQASLAFSQFRVKAAFDYQAFLVADITSFEFLMYNVRNRLNSKGDRLVAMLDGEAVQVFCTATSASQGLALYQAFQRLVQEKRSNYEASLSEIEKFMKRKSVSAAHALLRPKTPTDQSEDKAIKSPISLHTDVIVTLKAVNIGAFPGTFSDHQVFKLEALNAQARFAVIMESGKVHSSLGLTLGQLRIGLAGVKKVGAPKSVGEISVEDVVSNATGSRGGTILKVPKVEATMQTWQVPNSNHIDYIFKSSFEGKVEVGWNYSRIGYIRNMWASHSKALAQKLGKPLPPSAVKITGVSEKEDGSGGRVDGEQRKITAEVNVPQSKYEYTALEAPVIETPQLKDMGEATPPLEWIGLHRDRLPNLTHQIVIVTLLEIASEVEDAYEKILGSS